jgi:integrator complex subunit 11
MMRRVAALWEVLVDWTTQKLRQDTAETGHNPFRSPRFAAWDRDLMNAPGPCVLFATPGMLQGGASLEVFKAWAPDPKNLVLLPGYCLAGTVGNMLAGGNSAKGKVITLNKRTGETVHVKCKVSATAAQSVSETVSETRTL